MTDHPRAFYRDPPSPLFIVGAFLAGAALGMAGAAAVIVWAYAPAVLAGLV